MSTTCVAPAPTASAMAKSKKTSPVGPTSTSCLLPPNRLPRPAAITTSARSIVSVLLSFAAEEGLACLLPFAQEVELHGEALFGSIGLHRIGIDVVECPLCLSHHGGRLGRDRPRHRTSSTHEFVRGNDLVDAAVRRQFGRGCGFAGVHHLTGTVLRHEALEMCARTERAVIYFG